MNQQQPVALGSEPADVVVRGGRVYLPELNEFRARDVAIRNDRIAALPEDASDVVGEETTVVTADGKAVVPGFVDAHTHVDIHQTFETAFPRSLEGGTTTVITEVATLGGMFGADGVEELLAATSYLPITVRATVPPQQLQDTFEPRRADDEEAERLVGLLDDDRVVGVGETDWIHAVGRDTPAERLYERAEAVGKRIGGHAAGCSGRKLAAFASIVDNDHEAIASDQVVERLENGIHAIGRYGSIRDDIPPFAEAVREVDSDELSLSTDGMWPRELLSEGHMDAVIRRAIEEGIEPADALGMATLAPAAHFGLDDRGSLAPGNVADVVLLDDLERVTVSTVISGGEIVVRNGQATVASRSHEYPERFYDSVSVDVDPDAFVVPAAEVEGDRVRGIAHGGGLVSRETTVSPPVRDGALVADPAGDVLKATLFDRHPDGTDRHFTGFLSGVGLETGAVATTVTWETPGLLVVGASDESMRRAVERVVELDGGWAVVDGEVVAELPLRVGGVCSDLALEETAQLYDAVETALRSIGADGPDPMLGLQTLTFPGVPELKLSLSGYADVIDRDVVGLDPDQ